MKPYIEWTNDELWRHEQMNFAAHMAVMFIYLQKHGLSVDEFVRYTAEEVISGWKGEVNTAAEMMNAAVVNVRANGGEVLEGFLGDETCASATVTFLLKEDVMSAFRSPPEVTGKFWNKFIPIAEALDMRFEWERLGNGQYHIQVRK